MKNAQQKADEWKAYAEAPIREPDKKPTLAVGTVVRAIRPLDPLGANVPKGTLGSVFGEANCYNDGAGPIVQWFDGTELGGVCNVYPDDIEVVRVHNTVEVGHLDKYPEPETLDALKALLRYSWAPIDYTYASLTVAEKKIVTTELFAKLAAWATD